MTFNKTALSGMAGLCLLLAATPAALAVSPGTIEIKDFVGSITLNTGPDFTIDITEQSQAQKISYEDTGSALSVNGNIKRPKGSDCKGLHGNLTWGDDDAQKTIRIGGYKNLNSYPSIVINAPDNIRLDIKNSIIFGSAGNVGSADIDDKYCSRFDIGNVKDGVSLTSGGSGNFTFQDTGDLKLDLGGSGDASFSAVGTANISIGGSGNLSIEKSGLTYLSLGGSGDIAIAEITGDLSARAGGSGDIDIETVNGGVNIKASGSTDIDINSINGPLHVLTSGSGNVDIENGRADMVNMKVSGSSNVSFRGEVKDANLKASGSGNIYIKRPSGQAQSQTSGSGNIIFD